MRERPILFNGEMVRAVLDGRKTQTRRVIKPQPTFTDGPYLQESGLAEFAWCSGEDDRFELRRCPYGQPGDRLWVRETWAAEEDYDSFAPSAFGPGGHKIWFKAGGDEPENGAIGKTRPSIFMPRWASRILLEVTDVRVERVQDISEEEARAEGIIDGGCLMCGEPEPCGCDDPRPDARDAFVWLWNSINAKRGYGWDVNPWVWVVEFKVISS